jgi:hypothetical protein
LLPRYEEPTKSIAVMPAATGSRCRPWIDASRALALAQRFAACFSSALGEITGAVILHGSLVLGDYVPGRATSICRRWPTVRFGRWRGMRSCGPSLPNKQKCQPASTFVL